MSNAAPGFLNDLDQTLADGMARLSADFGRRCGAYVSERQRPDGGFGGRRGESDVYYTDFALRILALAGGGDAAFAGAARYVAAQSDEPRDVVECFNRLNCARLLRARGLGAPVDRRVPPRVSGESGRGVYDLFLAALCCEMLGMDFPGRDGAVAQVMQMRRPGGGFSEGPGGAAPQTNATAAAAGLLWTCGALPEAVAAQAGNFLLSMQSAGGGLLAHAGSPEPDLLSTFTGLVALRSVGALERADLASVARFVRSLSTADGGFRSASSDPEADVEYTYYGLATAALLRAHASAAAGARPGGSGCE